MFFPLSTIKKFHVEIVFVACLRDLSWEVKIVYLFFQEDTSEKFLILLLSYLPVFWLQISSAFAIIFADCHGLSCVRVRASSYAALKRYLHAATRVPMFCPFSLFVFLFSSLHYHTCMFFLFPRRVPLDLEVGYEKSMLSRTDTFSITICFKELLLFITIFLKRTCFYLLFISIRTWNQVLSFLFRDSHKLCLRQHQLRNQKQLRPRNSLLAFYPQKANPYNEAF